MFKGYSEKSKARRALVQVHKIDAAQVDKFLAKQEDKWGYYFNVGETQPLEVEFANPDNVQPSDTQPVRMDPHTGLHEESAVDDAAEDKADEEASIRLQELANTPEGKANFASWPTIKLEEQVVAPADLPPGEYKVTANYDENGTVTGYSKVQPVEQQEDEVPPAPTASAFGAFAMAQLGGEPSLMPTLPAPAVQKQVEPQQGKIEKDRPEQNGVKRPSAGGLCRAVWDQLDAMRVQLTRVPTLKEIKQVATDKGWNLNNAGIEYYCWRRFNGIEGRATKS